MPSTEIRAETEIDASPEAVWAVLSDVEGWDQWNRVVLGLRLSGPLRDGTRGRVLLRLGRRVVPTPIVLKVVQPNRELTWVGGVRHIFKGRHGFRIEPTATGTRVVHTEVFSGLLTLPLKLVQDKMVRTYERVNEGLRRRCEGDA